MWPQDNMIDRTGAKTDSNQQECEARWSFSEFSGAFEGVDPMGFIRSLGKKLDANKFGHLQK